MKIWILNLYLNIPSPLQKIEDSVFDEHQIEVFIKRDDLIHSEISGNKWRKLKYNLEKFRSGKYDTLLTFGGAFSNHIAATACAGKMLGIKTIGIIRGEELHEKSNHTLSQAKKNGMKLVFVSRDIYDQRYERIYHEELRNKFGNILIVEEGGANFLGAQGVTDLIHELPFEPDYIYAAAGTGTTAAGLLSGTKRAKIEAIAVLKNGGFIKEDIRKNLYHSFFDDELVDHMLRRLNLDTNNHFGGYAKHTRDLLTFMQNWTERYKIQLDQVYTGKMVYAFYQHLESEKFVTGSKIVLLHTGGLQGVLR